MAEQVLSYISVGGVTYSIYDENAQNKIKALSSQLANGISFTLVTNAADTPAGVTWKDTKLEEQEVVGELVASAETTGFYLVPEQTKAGKTIYAEYVAVHTGGDYSWEKLGDSDLSTEVLEDLVGKLGKLAYKNDATGTINPEGDVEVTITPVAKIVNVTGTGTATATVSVTDGSTYTPAGTIDAPTFTGTATEVTVSGKAAGTVELNVDAAAETKNYTPTGTVSGTFKGTEQQIEVQFTPTGDVALEGITVTPTTEEISYLGSADVTMPKMQMEVSGQTLILGWTDGSTKAGTTKSIVTGVEHGEATAKFTGKQQTVQVPYTPAGELQGLTFAGTGVGIGATFTGGDLNLSGSCTPQGNIAAPVFHGNAVGLEATIDEVSVTASGEYTPAQPQVSATFTGNQTTVTVK